MNDSLQHTNQACVGEEDIELSVISSGRLNEYSKDTCAICLEHYRNAIYLECMHAFCDEPCLQNLRDR